MLSLAQITPVYSVSLVSFLLLGLVLFAVALRRPSLFLHVLIAGAVLGAGPKIEGHGFIDEYLLDCVLIGAFFTLPRFNLRSLAGLLRDKILTGGFFPWLMIYFVVQSVRGLVVSGDWRVIRFVLLFGALLLAYFQAASGKEADREPDSVLRTVSWTTCAYMALYLLCGFFSSPRGGTALDGWDRIGRFDLQYYAWAGTTVAVIPVFLGYAVALFQITANKFADKYLGWAAIILATVTAFYYDSRSLMMAIPVYIIFSFFAAGIKRASVMTAIFVVTALLYIQLTRVSRLDYLHGILESTKLFSENVRPSDRGRRVDMLAAIRLTTDGSTSDVWGYGWYQHRTKLAYSAEELREGGSGKAQTGGKTVLARPAAFSSFLVDTGWLGIFLILGSFFEVMVAIFRNTRDRPLLYRWPLILCLCFVGTSIFVGQPTDLVLLYLYLMPAGFMAQLSKSGEASEF